MKCGTLECSTHPNHAGPPFESVEVECWEPGEIVPIDETGPRCNEVRAGAIARHVRCANHRKCPGCEKCQPLPEWAKQKFGTAG